MLNTLNPYTSIDKQPAIANGIDTGYFQVHVEQEYRDKEGNMRTDMVNCGKPVSSNYLLIPNREVKDIVDDLADQTNFKFDNSRYFFNGKAYMYTMTTENVVGEVDVGDPVNLGIGAWNSYDGSKAFSLFMFINRLICTNGMLSKTMFNTFRFKHTQQNSGWQDEAQNAVQFLQSGPAKLDNWIESAKQLLVPLDMDALECIRKNHIDDIPVSIYGKIMDKFWADDKRTGWEFLNAGTNILWHSDKPTVAQYDNNALFVDGMLEYGHARA